MPTPIDPGRLKSVGPKRQTSSKPKLTTSFSTPVKQHDSKLIMRRRSRRALSVIIPKPETPKHTSRKRLHFGTSTIHSYSYGTFRFMKEGTNDDGDENNGASSTDISETMCSDIFPMTSCMSGTKASKVSPIQHTPATFKELNVTRKRCRFLRSNRKWKLLQLSFKRILSILFSHVGLCGLVGLYAMIGAYMFQAIELPYELQRIGHVFNDTENIAKQIRGNISGWQTISEKDFKELAERVLRDYEKKLAYAVNNEGYRGDDNLHEPQWSFTGALLYSVSIFTTIGYGHIAPKTTLGRMATIIYAMFGIPLMLLCLANIAESLAGAFSLIYRKICCGLCTLYDKRQYRRAMEGHYGVSTSVVGDPSYQLPMGRSFSIRSVHSKSVESTVSASTRSGRSKKSGNSSGNARLRNGMDTVSAHGRKGHRKKQSTGQQYPPGFGTGKPQNVTTATDVHSVLHAKSTQSKQIGTTKDIEDKIGGDSIDHSQSSVTKSRMTKAATAAGLSAPAAGAIGAVQPHQRPLVRSNTSTKLTKGRQLPRSPGFYPYKWETTRKMTPSERLRQQLKSLSQRRGERSGVLSPWLTALAEYQKYLIPNLSKTVDDSESQSYPTETTTVETTAPSSVQLTVQSIVAMKKPRQSVFSADTTGSSVDARTSAALSDTPLGAGSTDDCTDATIGDESDDTPKALEALKFASQYLYSVSHGVACNGDCGPDNNAGGSTESGLQATGDYGRIYIIPKIIVDGETLTALKDEGEISPSRSCRRIKKSLPRSKSVESSNSDVYKDGRGFLTPPANSIYDGLDICQESWVGERKPQYSNQLDLENISVGKDCLPPTIPHTVTDIQSGSSRKETPDSIGRSLTRRRWSNTGTRRRSGGYKRRASAATPRIAEETSSAVERAAQDIENGCSVSDKYKNRSEETKQDVSQRKSKHKANTDEHNKQGHSSPLDSCSPQPKSPVDAPESMLRSIQDSASTLHRRGRRHPVDTVSVTSRKQLSGYVEDDDNDDDDDDQSRMPVWVGITMVIAFIILGGLVFALWEGWNLFDGAYFCFITLTTVGKKRNDKASKSGAGFFEFFISSKSKSNPMVKIGRMGVSERLRRVDTKTTHSTAK